MNVAIYTRVSTLDQDPAMQARELRAYVERQGWTVHQEYSDRGVSGAKASRPALNRLMKDARLKRFDAVLVWKLDRFGRSLPQLIENVQALDSCGVRFLAVTQSIDTDQRNPCGRLLLHLLAAMAEFERETILERVRAGMANAKAEGKHIGRPARVFNRDRVVKLRDAGKSWRAISAELGIPVMTAVDAYRVRKGVDHLAPSSR